VADLATDVAVQPLLPRLTEGANYVLDAAMQYGFKMSDTDGEMVCTETALINFVDAAREQGRRDAGAEPKEWPNAAR